MALDTVTLAPRRAGRDSESVVTRPSRTRTVSESGTGTVAPRAGPAVTSSTSKTRAARPTGGSLGLSAAAAASESDSESPESFVRFVFQLELNASRASESGLPRQPLTRLPG